MALLHADYGENDSDAAAIMLCKMGQIFLLFGTGAALGSGGGASEVGLQNGTGSGGKTGGPKIADSLSDQYLAATGAPQLTR
jgi:hypothetical protein